MDEYEYLQREQESAALVQESEQQHSPKTEKSGDVSNVPNGQNKITPFERSLNEAPAEVAEGIDMRDKRPDKLIDLSADGQTKIIPNPSKKNTPELASGQNPTAAPNATIPNNEALQTTATGVNSNVEAPLMGGALLEDKKMLAPQNPADPKMGEKDVKLLGKTKPADAAQTPAPESQYWTKELLQPFAKVLAPEQMAELDATLAYIHPDKQFASADLKQNIVFPAIPFVVPVIVQTARGLWLGYRAYKTLKLVEQVATQMSVSDAVETMLTVTLPAVEVTAERPKTTVSPTPISTDFIDWLPFSILLSVDETTETNQETSETGKYTEPTLPPSSVVEDKGVSIRHNYKSNDHPPAHLHVEGKGESVKIGANGKPLKGEPPLSREQQRVVDANLPKIRATGNKIRRYFKYHEVLKNK